MVKQRRVIRVTPSQVATAQDQVERDRIAGRKSDPAIVKIANALKVSVTHSKDGWSVTREVPKVSSKVQERQRDGIAHGL
jgi:hypothetical protein